MLKTPTNKPHGLVLLVDNFVETVENLRGFQKKEIILEHIDKVEGTFLRRPAEEARPMVSAAVIRRLPRYHRYLGQLLKEDKLRISSAELSRLMEVTASQIRQDLNCFGGFGQQGYGYNVKYLHQKIGELLGVEEGYSAVIVGAGNLGRALVSSTMFDRCGVKMRAMFDVDPALIGREFAQIPVLSIASLGDYCRENRVEIGILATPGRVSQEMATALAEAGISGIWNFSNVELKLPGHEVVIENIHLGDSLMKLCFAVKSAQADGGEETK